MGQYYQSVLVDKEGKVKVYYNYGLKLMEHSWFCNSYVNYVCKKLVNNPCKVAWVGDYANPKEDGEHLADLITLGQGKGKQIKLNDGWNTLDYYMVNHTKRLYVDMAKYFIETARNQKDDWIIHPLPLLTAVGNGKGGGDYYKGYPGIEDVGSWAGDEIEFADYNRWKEITEEAKNSMIPYVEDMYFFSEEN